MQFKLNYSTSSRAKSTFKALDSLRKQMFDIKKAKGEPVTYKDLTSWYEFSIEVLKDLRDNSTLGLIQRKIDFYRLDDRITFALNEILEINRRASIFPTYDYSNSYIYGYNY